MTSPYKVIVIYQDTPLEGYGIPEDDFVCVKTAKRIIAECGLEVPQRLKCLDRIDRISVETVDRDIRKTWPLGIKTIACYYFLLNSSLSNA